MKEEAQNNLRKLYEEMLKVREKVAPEVHVSLYPIGRMETDMCFIIDIDKENSILVFNDKVFNEMAPFLLSTTEHSSFKYIVHQYSSDEYTVVKPSISNQSENADSEQEGYKNISRTYLQVFELLKSECLPINEKIKQTILDIAKTHYAEVPEICEFLKRVANRIGKDKDYHFNKEYNVFTFKSNDEERLFHLFFLGQKQPRKVCRYCSLESLYQMLSNQTIRLYGLHGMNDNSEYQHAHKSFLGSELSEDDVEQMNRIYIMSGSEISKRDDLEMWRLYGDDGRGACLDFDKKSIESPFVFAKVIYDFNRTENAKRKKDARWKLLSHLSTKLRIVGFQFQFRDNEKWMSFFKSGDYCYEQEVRLLYFESKDDHSSHDWVLSNSNNIINPFVQFDMSIKDGEIMANTFPLKLNKIILGPKCPERALNVKQIKNLLLRDPNLRIMNISVEESEINNYR